MYTVLVEYYDGEQNITCHQSVSEALSYTNLFLVGNSVKNVSILTEVFKMKKSMVPVDSTC